MITGPIPVTDGSDSAPKAWIATGPLLIDAGDDAAMGPLPTGPVPITSTTTTTQPPVRLLLQALAVVVAAGVVGLAVFGTLRSTTGERDTGRGDSERSDGLAVEPGPGEAGAEQDVLGSKRGTAGIGRGPSDEEGEAAADGATAPAQGGDAGASDPTATDRSSGRAGPTGDGSLELAGPSTVVERPGSPTTATDRSDPSTTGPFGRFTSSTGVANTTVGPTRPTVGSTSTTRRPTPTTGRPTTTKPATTIRQTTTTPSTSTPTTRPTTSVPRPAELIAAPSGGSVVDLGSRLDLRANEVPGASRYCWVLNGGGGEFSRCRSDTSLNRSTSGPVPGPGPVTIRAEARSANGAVLMSQEIDVTLLARNFVNTPAAGSERALDRRLRLSAKSSPDADRYCWTLVQGSTTAGPFCTSDRRVDLAAGSPALADFAPGPVTVRARAERAGVVIGRQVVRFDFTGS